MRKRKLKKSVWLPLTLLLYCGAITWYFAPRLIADGQATKLWLSLAFELLVIGGIFFAFRRKEKLSGYWDNNDNKG